LVHRDIKPSNILLENSVERVKITDFGLARAVNDTSLTAAGQIAGTPEYMAPEQARAEPVDQRSDLFSFGCVLYEMATGLSPFRAQTAFAALRKVCEEKPRPAHEVHPAVPEWLSGLIAGLLVKEPGRRTRSAQELAEELNGYLAQMHQPGRARLPPRAHPASVPRHSRRGPRWLAAGVTLLVGAGLLWWTTRGRDGDFVVGWQPGPARRMSGLPCTVTGARGNSPLNRNSITAPGHAAWTASPSVLNRL
jgi:serine/threonine protein kinase